MIQVNDKKKVKELDKRHKLNDKKK